MSAEGFRPGVRLGLDIGTVRIGVARTDADATLAMPVRTVSRSKAAASRDLDEIVDLIRESEPLELLVGLPVGLDGREGPAATSVLGYLASLVARMGENDLSVSVRLVDERFTTAAATRGLREAGRDARAGRSVVDQAAAVIIVQDAVDTERRTGQPPGRLLEPRGSGTERSMRTAP